MLTAETIDRIVRFDGQGMPVVSLQVGVDRDPTLREGLPTRVNSLLDTHVRPLTTDEGLDHAQRLSLRTDIERIWAAVTAEHWRPGGMAIYACSARDLYEEVPLPQTQLRDQAVVDVAPYVRPMLAVLDEYRRTCVAVIDRAKAQFWEIYQDEMREVTKVRDRVLRKSNFAAGRSEYRMRNKADELTKRHYRAVVQQLEELFRTEGFDLLVLGGHQHEIPMFTDFLPAGLRERVAGTFGIDPDKSVVAEVRAEADAVLARYAAADEQRLVSDLLEKLASGGLAAAGLGDCLWAGSVAAIGTLLIRAGASEPGVVCDQSGWLALTGQVCPLCGNPTRRIPDVIEELAEAVIAEGGSVRHIRSDDRLDGPEVAAYLRFPLPAPALAASS